MAIVDELIAILGFKVSGEEAAGRFGSIVGGLNNKLVLLAGGAVAAGAAVAAVGVTMGMAAKAVIAASSQFEDFQIALETIEGSVDKARRSLSWIAEFGKTTPFEVAKVTRAFVSLRTYGIDPLANNALRILGDTASAMSKPLQQAVEAFTDATTGEFERLKEFGLKAKTAGEQVTFVWTRNNQEMSKTIRKSGAEIRAFLLENFGSRFAGAMERASRSWTGMTSNLSDRWGDFKKRIGDAGFFDFAKKQLAQLLALIERLDREGKLDQWAQAISDALIGVSRAFIDFGKTLYDLNEYLPLLKALGAAVLLLAIKFAPVTTAILAVVAVIDDFFTYLKGGESVLGDFIEMLKGVANKVLNIDWRVSISASACCSPRAKKQTLYRID